MRATTLQVVRSAGFYPTTFLYVTAVCLILLISEDLLPVVVAILALLCVAIAGLLYSALRELKTVHKLVNGQHTALLDRIDQLSEALLASGEAVPTDPTDKAKTQKDRR